MASTEKKKAFPPPASGYRPRCFFDIEINKVSAGRVIFELFADLCPKTCENFRALCTGEKGEGRSTLKPLHYKNTPIHRVVKGFIIQGGDFSAGDGTGGESIYGGTFKDENFELQHDRPHLLSMANRGPNTNGSQFFVTLAAAPHLDNVHTVFGHVILGHEIITDVENQKVNDEHKPYADIRITHCGELVKKSKSGNAKEIKKKKTSKKVSSSESDSSSDSEKEKKKKKKKMKSDQHKIDDDKPDTNSAEQKEDAEADLNFIPTVPNSFLLRRSRTPSPIRERRKQDGYNSGRGRNKIPMLRNRVNQVSRSGKKLRGRGIMRYRTPSPESETDEENAGTQASGHVENKDKSKDTKRRVDKRSRSPENRRSRERRRSRSRDRRWSRDRALRRSQSPRRNERNRRRSRSRDRSRSHERKRRRSRSTDRHRHSSRRSRDRSRENRSPRKSSERRGKFDRHRSKSGSGSDSSLERKTKSNKRSVKDKIGLLLQKQELANQISETQVVEKEGILPAVDLDQKQTTTGSDLRLDEPMAIDSPPQSDNNVLENIDEIPLPGPEQPQPPNDEPIVKEPSPPPPLPPPQPPARLMGAFPTGRTSPDGKLIEPTDQYGDDVIVTSVEYDHEISGEVSRNGDNNGEQVHDSSQLHRKLDENMIPLDEADSKQSVPDEKNGRYDENEELKQKSFKNDDDDGHSKGRRKRHRSDVQSHSDDDDSMVEADRSIRKDRKKSRSKKESRDESSENERKSSSKKKHSKSKSRSKRLVDESDYESDDNDDDSHDDDSHQEKNSDRKKKKRIKRHSSSVGDSDDGSSADDDDRYRKKKSKARKKTKKTSRRKVST